MVSQQSGLLERLRAQRENMATAAGVMPGGIPDDDDAGVFVAEAPSARSATPALPAADEEQGRRISLLETDHEEIKRRLDAVEATVRTGFTDLRNELPSLIGG